MAKKLHVKAGDTVMVISGDDKGQTGKVLVVSPKEGKIIVEGLNKVKKHVKPRKAGERGGIVEAEAPMYACKVQVYCPHCKKAVRVKHQFVQDGDKLRKVRVCGNKDCGKTL